MAKRSHPALYEVIRGKGPLIAPKSREQQLREEQAREQQARVQATSTSPTNPAGSDPGSNSGATTPATSGVGSTGSGGPSGTGSVAGSESATSTPEHSTGLAAPRASVSFTSTGSTQEVRSEPARQSQGAAVLFTPGHQIRVPVGYIWITAGALLAAIIATYVIGHAAGRSMMEREYGPDLIAALSATDEARDPLTGHDASSLQRGDRGTGGGSVRDPLQTRQGTGRSDGSGRTSGSGRDANAGTGGSGASPGGSSGGGTPIGPDDPRLEGHFYYVLAHGTEQGAPRMAAFLREQGLDAAVVPDHNGRLRKVIALPGLPDRVEQSPQAVALRAAIEEGLRKWRAHSGERRRSPEYYIEPAPTPSSRRR